jgi:hypothetical protein
MGVAGSRFAIRIRIHLKCLDPDSMNPAIPCVLLFVRRVLSEKLLAKEEDEDDIAIGKSLKVHKNENFFGFDFEFCLISLLVMHK